MELNTVLLFSNFSKMEDGKMWLLTLEFLITPTAKLHSMAIAMTLRNSGCHWWRKLTPNFMETTSSLAEATSMKLWLTWLEESVKSSTLELLKQLKLLKVDSYGKTSRNTTSKDSFLVVQTLSRMIKETQRKEWETQESYSTTPMVFSK